MRLLLVSSIAWRLTEHLFLSWWRYEVFGMSSRFFPDPYTLNVLLAPFWSVLIQCCLIFVIALIWYRSGGLWGLALLLVDATIADQNLPIGWGALASHPAILLCVMWDLGPEFLRRQFHWIVLIQISFMYGMSVFSKDFRFWLVEPGAAATILDGGILSTSIGRSLSGALSPSGGVALDALILGVQLSSLLFLVFWKHSLGRKIVAWNLILFHVMSAFVFNIRPFALACLSIVSMAFQQTPVAISKRRHWVAGICLVVWITGMISAVFWIWVPGFQFLRLRQSWRIMERPFVVKELLITVTRNGVPFEVTGRESQILSHGLINNPKLRTYFPESLCRHSGESIRVTVSSDKKNLVDLTHACSVRSGS